MSPFFFTALPRSGTTFLANFFTHAGVFCWHEGLVGCKDIKEYTERMKLRDYCQVGDSDSGLPWCYKDVRDAMPDGIWVGIRRDPSEVMASLTRINFYPGDEAFGRLLDAHEACLLGCDWVVDFKDLFLTETLRDLWQNVTGLRFDSKRAEMLAQVRIEPDMTKYVPRYAAHFLGA